MSSDSDSDREARVRNSSYYLEKFGSRSPEEYKSLRITNIDPKIGEHDLDNVLRKLFSRYGEMHCKVVNPRDVHERIAYVNFDFGEDARDARTKGAGKILTSLGRKVRVDPANVVRDQGGKMLRKDSESRKSRSPPPPPDRYRDSYSSRPRIIDHRTRPAGRSPPPYRGGGRGGYDMSPPPEFEHPRPTWDYKEGDPFEDSFASRTLFVGNLEIDIGISEIRHFFEKYGTVEEIDIKTPQNGITAYAFVRFSDILSAREARKRCSGEYLRDNRCIIGWGKPIVTRRLWVGGFTSDISLSWLEKEFDRFGPVEKIDFNRGETHAFVLYADQRAATEAFRKLRGLRMKNGVLENVFHVDYADASMYERSTFDDRPRRRSNSRSRSPADRNRSSKRRRSNSGSRSPPPRKRNASSDRDRSPSKSGRRNKDSSSKKDNGRSKRRRSSSSASPHRRRNGVENNGSGKGDNVYSSPATQRQTGLVAAAEFAADSLQDLHEIRSPIWTGVLVLKKSAYPLQLFKMAGDDDLVDAYLRNERAESVQLNITQRYKLDQPRTGEILRVSASAMEHCAYLLAVPNPNVRQDLVEKLADLQSKHLKCLVEYFEDKNAAGVINLSASGNSNNNGASSTTKIAPQGVAYAFPHCTYADDFVATLCPKLSVWRKCKDECLLIVLQKSLTSQTTE